MKTNYDGDTLAKGFMPVHDARRAAAAAPCFSKHPPRGTMLAVPGTVRQSAPRFFPRTRYDVLVHPACTHRRAESPLVCGVRCCRKRHSHLETAVVFSHAPRVLSDRSKGRTSGSMPCRAAPVARFWGRGLSGAYCRSAVRPCTGKACRNRQEDARIVAGSIQAGSPIMRSYLAV